LSARFEAPSPPRRFTFKCSYGVGRRRRVDVELRLVKSFMEGRPYELVVEAVGPIDELVRDGVAKREELGRPDDHRARAGLLRYRRIEPAEEGSA
jgi:hypothetical protein